MLAFDWLERTDKIGCNIFPVRMTQLCRAIYATRLFGNTFLNFVSNFSLEGGNWVICLWQHHIYKMGYFKCSILFNICTISFLSCYDIGCTMFRYHIHLWFCWSLNLQKLVLRNLFFWIRVPLGGRGGSCVCGHGLLSLYSSYTKLIFSLSLTVICAELCCQTTWGHIPLLCAKLEP